jgi:hypothetical protein
MSQTLRQSNLFAGQDWTVIYQAFNQVNFNAYDFPSIRDALIDYIRINYPEDFNDWTESSEFVAIIEMLAYLASSLAFRIDLNTRENFLDTATRRESVFRLARYLSYNPRRCLSSVGLLKLNQVRTNQTIFDSNGQNLANVPVNWNDPLNPDWLEQFVLVLNSAFQQANPFGVPVKTATVSGVPVQRYDLNLRGVQNLAFPFNATVGGTPMNFEFCNTDFGALSQSLSGVDPSAVLKEKTPNLFNSWSLIYRTDGNGNASANTGFFSMFKQGTLSFSDFVLNDPIPNRVIDIDAVNVNQNDVWVQTVSDSGLVLAEWTRVPAIFGSNLVYNDVDRLTRDIFQVVTRDQNGSDSISIRFGDGNFGNVPTGRIRVLYRTSNNLTYNIQPNDIVNQNLSLPYQNPQGGVSTLSLNFSLVTPVSNSLSRESTSSIRQRAPAVYYSQNRMVNGEDYNVFPLQNSQALKIKAVNRTYSGHSRYIDINDPTGSYANVNVFADDLTLFRELVPQTTTIPLTSNLNTSQIIDSVLQPLLSGPNQISNVNVGLFNFYVTEFPRLTPANLIWTSANLSTAQSQGQFSILGVPVLLPNGANGLNVNSIVEFGPQGWATVINNQSQQLSNFGTVMNRPIANNSAVTSVIPGLRTTLLPEEKNAVAAMINSKKNFGLRYNTSSFGWQVIQPEDLAANASFSLVNQGSRAQRNLDASWLIQFMFLAGSGWTVMMRSANFVVESERSVRFFFVNTGFVVDQKTESKARDQVRILRYNLGANSAPLANDVLWAVEGQQIYPDGYLEPSQLRVKLWDTAGNGVIDNPDNFSALVGANSLVFWRKTVVNGQQRSVPVNIDGVFFSTKEIPNPVNTELPVGSVIYVTNPGVFLELTHSPLRWQDVSTQYESAQGRRGLSFQWKHYAASDRRIDPSIMNIIDMYVLTNNYDQSMRTWVGSGRGDQEPQPQPPTPEDLRTQFSELERFKMMTDQVVWHPIRYKLLFGKSADPELRAVFKVVKISNSSVTDSEIKSRVIQAIDDYFSIVNWDFGQSFFFTELAAYIHQTMPTLISSVVIVPSTAGSQFGDLFEITSDPDQLFLSAARANDVQVVPNLNPNELRIAQ